MKLERVERLYETEVEILTYNQDDLYSSQIIESIKESQSE